MVLHYRQHTVTHFFLLHLFYVSIRDLSVIAGDEHKGDGVFVD